MMEELKACPFCGGKAEVIRQWKSEEGTGKNIWIRCKNCGVETVRYDTDKEAAAKWNRRAAPENKPLTLEQLKKMDGERVWTQFRGLGMYGLVAYHSDPDGDDGDNVYITNNLGGRDTFEKILDQGGTVYARKPEGIEKP